MRALSAAIFILACARLGAQDAREIVRRSVELDQANWLRMKDYTWIAHETERRLDSQGQVKSQESKAWETVILYGEPHRRMLERNGAPLPEQDQRKERQKLDEAVAKLERETPEQRQRRLDSFTTQREKDREFLRDIVDVYDFRLEGEESVDRHQAWAISAVPRAGAHPLHSEAKALLKMRGKIWIDKTEYQWVRLEAETTGTIAYGFFLARLNSGAKLFFEQTRVNDEVWLPKREVMSGSGRLGLLKKIALEQELTWNNYRKFQVESKIVSSAGN